MKPKILVVEDSPTQAERVRLLLEDNGYEIEVARDGQEGLEHIRSRPPDLIIADVMMPRMDGYALCRAVKSSPRTKTIPFVLLTDRHNAIDIITGLEHGADNFITKPFEDEYLLERLRRIFAHLAFRNEGQMEMEVTLRIGDRNIVLSPDKQQIVELLFSTYEELCLVNTQLEEKTRALEAAQEELLRQERLAVLGQLAGGVSHELRNPLGVIKNSVYYLNMVLPDDSKARKHLTIVEREIAAADRIITGLLDFARVAPSNRAPMDLNQTVREYLDRKPPPDNVVLVVTLAELPPLVQADAGQVELILGNLVSNAIQAMPEGGTLTVETSATEHGARVAVADTGTGIRAEDLAKIFQPLFTTKAKGIGLGLAVALRLAHTNGAEIVVESEPARGSRFDVRFST